MFSVMSYEFAAFWLDNIAVGLAVIWTIGGIFVFLTPLDASVAESHRLHGEVIVWSWIRLMTPFINIYALAFLAGGAALSAWKFLRVPEARNRYLGNILIAIGALLPAIGGTATRFGYVEALYVTELIGLLLIFAGYRKCVAAPRTVRVAEAVEATA